MHNILHTIDVDTLGAIIIFMISAVHFKGSEEGNKKYSNPKACQVITALKIVKSHKTSQKNFPQNRPKDEPKVDPKHYPKHHPKHRV